MATDRRWHGKWRRIPGRISRAGTSRVVTSRDQRTRHSSVDCRVADSRCDLGCPHPLRLRDHSATGQHFIGTSRSAPKTAKCLRTATLGDLREQADQETVAADFCSTTRQQLPPAGRSWKGMSWFENALRCSRPYCSPFRFKHRINF